MTSCLDSKASAAEISQANQYMCNVCSGLDRPAFATPKALASHMRTVHKIRTPMRAYADSNGVCPACATTFCSRLRLLAHLCDSRRPRCRNYILGSGLPTLSAERVAKLDSEDREARRLAKRQGHTTVLAKAAAVKADGRRTGRVAS